MGKLKMPLERLLVACWRWWDWPGPALLARPFSAEPPKFRTLPVTQGDLTIGPSATGMVEPVETVDVGARSSAEL